MWFLPEQYVASGKTPPRRISLHGPPYVLGDRAYLSYGAAGRRHPRHLGHRAADARLATGDRRRILQHDRDAHRDPTTGAKPVAGQHRSDRGTATGGVQLRRHRRHQRRAEPPPHVAAADTPACGGCGVSELQHARRALRPAQSAPSPRPRAVRRRQPDVHDVVQRRAAGLRHQRRLPSARDRLVSP